MQYTNAFRSLPPFKFRRRDGKEVFGSKLLGGYAVATTRSVLACGAGRGTDSSIMGYSRCRLDLEIRGNS